MPPAWAQLVLTVRSGGPAVIRVCSARLLWRLASGSAGVLLIPAVGQGSVGRGRAGGVTFSVIEPLACDARLAIVQVSVWPLWPANTTPSRAFGC